MYFENRNEIKTLVFKAWQTHNNKWQFNKLIHHLFH
jgi:hypothetical protein